MLDGVTYLWRPIRTYIALISLRVIQMPVTKAQTLVNPAGTAKTYSVTCVGSVKNRGIAITTTATLATRRSQPSGLGYALLRTIPMARNIRASQ